MEIEYGQVLKQTEEIAAKASPFTLKVQGVGTFGNRGEDRVIFLNVPFSDLLVRLRKLCPWPPDRPFAPHITLARIRHPQRFAIVKKKAMKTIQDADFEMEVKMLRLYSEVNGVKQTPLENIVLSGTNAK